MRFLRDPALFNYLIIGLFFCAAIRWGIARNWPQVAYWLSSIAITIAVTMMAVK
jgi:hypothetical protein